MNESRSPRRIQSVDNALDIFEALRDEDGLTISNLSDTIDLSTGTLHTYLQTLADRGYVEKVGDEYRIGGHVLPLGEHVRANSDLFQAAKSVVDDYANESGEAVHIVTESNAREIVLYGAYGEQAVGEELHMNSRARPARNLHCSAAGKAMLAHMQPDRREAILADYEMVPRTDNTTVQRAELLEELEATREEGVARNDEEQVEGLRAVATPVQQNDRVLGAISFSAPKSRLQQERFLETVPEDLIQLANIIEVEIQSLS